MKIMILFTCVVALASAGWIPSFGGHHGEEHHPVILDGVPVDTPEVQHARAEHLAAVAAAKAHAGHAEFAHHEAAHGYEGHDDGGAASFEEHDFGGHDEHGAAGGGGGYSSVVHHDYAASQHYSEPAYATSHHEPVVDHAGTPLDTPEVEEAKAAHFAEVDKALARLHDHAYFGHGHVLHRRDLADYAHSGEAHGYELHQQHAPAYEAAAPAHYDHYHHEEAHQQEVPQIGHDGQPLDTAEVAHAKALHFHAHQEALARVASAKHSAAPEPAYHY